MLSHGLPPRDAAHKSPSGATLKPSKAAAVNVMFASLPLFASCSKRELKLVTKIAVVEHRAAGSTLMSEGQTDSYAFVILQGACRVLRSGRRVGIVEAGGVVGELSMLTRAPRNATVIAEAPLEVAILGRREFLSLLDKSPSITRKILESLAARVQELDARAPC
jgi:CRP/FNR family transcriptional regulator, cyclic AMP receptor protein